MDQRIAISGVTLIDGTGRDPVERAVVVVEASTIVAVGRESDIHLDSDTRVLDGSGAALMPGIIDGHCHLGGASHPDEDRWVLEDDRFQSIASVAQVQALIRHGVTSVRDISVNGPHLRTAIARGLIEGPSIVPCWRGLSRTGGHGDASGVPADLVRTSHPWGFVADGPEQLRSGVREIIKQGSHCIKVWASGGGLHENESEDVQHYSLEELRAVVEEADYAKLPVAAHCECASAARDAVNAGVWSIEHGEDLDEETIALMASKGVSMNPTLVLLTQWLEQSSTFGGPYGPPYIPGVERLPDDPREIRRLHHSHLSRNLLAARDAGVRIGVGSDSFCSELTPYGVQTLNEVMALVGAGMTEMEALVAATRSGAEILRIGEVTGTIELGKRADLLVLRANPLEDISRLASANMALIMKGGELVKDELPRSGPQPLP